MPLNKGGISMRKLYITFCLTTFIIFLGCASTTIMVTPEYKKSDTLAIGVTQQKTLGEPMIVSMDLYYNLGFIAENEYTPPKTIGLQLPTVARNSEWSCPRKQKEGTYRCKPTSFWGIAKALGIPQNASVTSAYNLIITSSGIPVGYAADPYDTVYRFPEQQPKVFRPTEIVQSGSFKKELIYNGKSKETIRIAYREFKDDFARPAFAQDLTYDLSESNEIGFKGMIIEVVKATNSFIKFIVKKPMTM